MDPPGQWLEALANNENTHKRKEDSLGMAGKTGGGWEAPSQGTPEVS